MMSTNTIGQLRDAVRQGNFEWRKHVLIRLAERQINQNTILRVILSGEVIEEYLEDKPFPSCLIFNIVEGKPYHVVVSFDSVNKKVYIITAYSPGLDKFAADFKTRRK